MKNVEVYFSLQIKENQRHLIVILVTTIRSVFQ